MMTDENYEKATTYLIVKYGSINDAVDKWLLMNPLNSDYNLLLNFVSERYSRRFKKEVDKP